MHQPTAIGTSQPLPMRRFPIVGTRPNSTLDFKTYRVTSPAFVCKAEMRRGELQIHGAPEVAVPPDDDDG
jgi:cyanophycinase